MTSMSTSVGGLFDMSAIMCYELGIFFQAYKYAGHVTTGSPVHARAQSVTQETQQ